MLQNIRILIVEDDPQIAMRTEALIHALGYSLLTTTDNSEEALKRIETENPDVLVIDIDINGDLNGVEVVERVKHKEIPVVFITAHTEEFYYKQAKKTQPVAYLVKPFNKFTFQTALETAVMNLSHRSLDAKTPLDWEQEVWTRDSFFVKRNNLLEKIKIDDIQYIQSEGNYCDIVSSKKIAVKMSLTQIQKKLPGTRFIRVHQRYVLQANLIENIDTSTNQLYIGKQAFPLGPKYKDDILKLITRI